MPLAARAAVLALAAGGLLVAPRPAAAQFVQPAGEPDPAVSTGAPEPAPRVDLRLTLSTFVYRESGAEPDPLVDGAAEPDGASPVRRFFSDLRLQMSAERLGGRDGRGVELDARVRQTAAGDFQAGAGSGSEYEVKTAVVRDRIAGLDLSLGRQTVLEVAATRVDGLRVARRLGASWTASLFGGAYPARGSRSVDTDYPVSPPVDRDGDGMAEAGDQRVVPVAAGAGLAYSRPTLFGDLGLAGIAPATGADAGDPDQGRAFASASGTWRPSSRLLLYHYGVVDVAGAAAPSLTNLSAGTSVNPWPALQLSASVHHVDTELLAIQARTLLEDPDPAAMGLVQNRVEMTRISSDSARGGASLALARQRFEISLSGALRRRPGIEVATVGGGAVVFGEARTAEGSVTLLDRRSIAGLRLAGTATWIRPLDREAGGPSAGVSVRLSGSRRLAGDRAELEVDVAAQRFRDRGPAGECAELDPLACLGSSRVRAAEAGALFTLEAGTSLLFLFDAHVGAEQVSSLDGMNGMVDWPTLFTVSGFGRLAWRFE